ncbi:MAG: multifunctional 2-oxoglutarate metabolism enzyme, partial [Solirubrobacteraceae bacterium]|nr:multifunctional 2-oxoglutarate metabolism enzyme [Solirubrobacteraceae bacterium]
MPQMGDSVSEGTILEWHKNAGDSISQDETLVEISTDKVDAEVPSPISGTVVKVHAAEGDTVNVGAVLAEIAPSANGDAPNGDAPAAAADEAAGEAVDIVMPAMGESVSEGIVLEWHKQPGDAIAADETIVEISTDKVDAEVPAPAAGTMGEILAPAGETVSVGQVIARMTAGGAAPAAAAPRPTSAPRPAGDAAPQPAGNGADANATPVARRVAAAHGIDLSGVKGTGPSGRIGKDDVLAAADGGSNGAAATTATPTAPPASATPLRGAAAMLARYMDESRSIPTATSFRTLTVTVLDGRRKQLKAAGQKVSFTHLIAYAIARAATERMPVMGRSFAEIDGKPHVVDPGQVNLGIAVDVERKDTRTLMVPVIRDAGRLSFTEFMAAFGDLIARARENQLTADDLQGANVSLTNPGGIGTIASVPRLMSGQGTIIATGSIDYPVGLGAIGQTIGAEKVMTMTSTYDHRVIQGAESGQFLQTVEAYLQGEHGFYEQVFSDLGVQLGPQPMAPAPGATTTIAPPEGDAAATATAAAASTGGEPDEALLQAVQAATSLIKAHRTHGHLAARLDPLGSEPEGDPALDPEPLGLTEEIMRRIPSKILRIGVPGATLWDALPHLRETYCGTIAYEIEHISSHRQRVWLREKIETGAFRTPLTDDEKRRLLRRLTQVDSLERFMHKAYLGQKQFSVEGLDMTVPMIDEMITLSGSQGGREVVIGMAHRGRLNVLAHNVGREYETIFREFEGASSIEAVTTIPQGGTGDVKYHHGAVGTFKLDDERSVLVRLESNPSHLEFVGPVVDGATRAVQTSRQGPHTRLDHNAAIPVVLHGDAAFPGQGVVAETFNLQALDGYTVGGTLHLIQNNQVGFTTDPDDSRSTRWASDLAKGFDVPIIHVNSDDVEASIQAVRLAFAFRQEFGHDVLIDLIGYRRFGHNEADEPGYTQPEMAAKVKDKVPARDIFAAKLVEQGVMTQAEVDAVAEEIWQNLSERHRALKEHLADSDAEQPTGGYELDRSPSPEVRTAVSAEELQALNESLLALPEGFSVHPKLARQLDRRRTTLGPDGGIDWAQAESLAFASLLSEGTPIRLTGQDSERGTFSQRHLVLHDHKTGQRVSPIQNLPSATAPMELHNSPLSEVA